MDKLDIEIEGKIYKRLFIIGIVAVICYVAITVLSFAIPRVYILDKNTVVDTEGSVKNGINTLYRGSLRLEIAGWAYKQGQDIKTFDSCFLLKNKGTERMYMLKTGKQYMTDLHVVEGGYNALNSGLYSQSIVLGLKDGEYELLILYKNDGENLLVDTGVTVEI